MLDHHAAHRVANEAELVPLEHIGDRDRVSRGFLGGEVAGYVFAVAVHWRFERNRITLTDDLLFGVARLFPCFGRPSAPRPLPSGYSGHRCVRCSSASISTRSSTASSGVARGGVGSS